MRHPRSPLGSSAAGRMVRTGLVAASAFALLVPAPVAAQLANPNFDAGLGDWIPKGVQTAFVAWDEFQGDPNPGSLRIYSAFPPVSHEFPRLSQCFAISPTFGVLATARARVDQLRPDDGCGIEVFFYTCALCACASIDNSYSGGAGVVVGWQNVSDQESAPENAASASVDLWTHLAPGPAFPGRGRGFGDTECRLDTVLLTVTLLRDGFENNDVCAWSSSTGWAGTC